MSEMARLRVALRVALCWTLLAFVSGGGGEERDASADEVEWPIHMPQTRGKALRVSTRCPITRGVCDTSKQSMYRRLCTVENLGKLYYLLPLPPSSFLPLLSPFSSSSPEAQ